MPQVGLGLAWCGVVWLSAEWRGPAGIVLTVEDEIQELLEEISYWHSLYITELKYRTMGGRPMQYQDRWENRALGTPEPGAPSA